MSGRHVIQYIPEKLIGYFENTNIPFSLYWVTFFSVTLLRQFIEAYSQKWNYFNSISPAFFEFFIHGVLCYLTIALLMTLIIHAITRIAIQQILRVILPGFILLIITPLLDLIITRGGGANIMYLLPDIQTNLLYTYLTVGGGYIGVTLGMRIEVLLVIIGSFFYFISKGYRFLASFISAWLVYAVIFLTGASPYFLKWFLGLIGMPFFLTNGLMIHFYLLLIAILAPLLFYLSSKELFLKMVSRINWQRLIHYQLMLLLGVALGLANVVSKTNSLKTIYQQNTINIILCMISLVFLYAGLSAKELATRAFKQTKDTHQHHYPVDSYNIVANVCIFLAILYSLFADIKSAFYLCLIIGSLYVYAFPPLQLKRLGIISKWLIAVNALALVLMGYLLVHQVERGFPNIIIGIILIGYALAANMMDLEDEPSITQSGSLTALFGAGMAKVIIGSAMALSYLAFYFILPDYSALSVLVMAGIIQFCLVNAKKYNPRFSMLFCNLTIGLMLLLMYFINAQSPL